MAYGNTVIPGTGIQGTRSFVLPWYSYSCTSSRTSTRMSYRARMSVCILVVVRVESMHRLCLFQQAQTWVLSFVVSVYTVPEQ